MKKEAKKAEPEKSRWQWLIEPQSVLVHPPGELFKDAIAFILLIVATYLVANYLHAINFIFFFIRWGSLALLVLTVATIVYALKLLAHLVHGIVRLRKQYKFAIFIAVVICAVLVVVYRDAIVVPIIRWLGRVAWINFNPFSFWWWYPPYWW